MVVLEQNESQIGFLQKFSSDELCLEYFIEKRWPDGNISCPFCGYAKVYRLNEKRHERFKCGNPRCYKKFSPLVRTIFENTKAPLRIWFYLIYSMAINKKNISSIQGGKNMGVTQKTMWGMMNRLRKCLKQDQDLRLSGVVEVDEVFVSKGNLWTRWGGISTRKSPILGLIERGGKLVVKMIDNRQRDTIVDIIRQYVKEGSTVYTDGYAGYRTLTNWYIHDWVEHSSHEYVRGEVHTNTIENVWSFLKKAIRNAHHHVSEKHVEGYCNEIVFRFNYRHLSFAERFDEILFRAANTINT